MQTINSGASYICMGGPYILWSWADDLKGNIFSPWIQVKSSAMKVDSGLVIVAIPVATKSRTAPVVTYEKLMLEIAV